LLEPEGNFLYFYLLSKTAKFYFYFSADPLKSHLTLLILKGF